MQFPKAPRAAASSHAAEAAQTLALQALSWIAAEPERLAGLLATTGLWPDEVRARVGDPAFLGGVLDYLLADEALLLAFCGEAEIAPDTPARLRAFLPGGAVEV